MAEITASLPVLANVWLGQVSKALIISRALTICAGSKLSSGLFRSNLFWGPWLGLTCWAIVGGESGPRSRPMSEEWVGEIEAACRKAATAFFSSNGVVFAKRAPVGT